jgi:hypothetical protein
VLARDLSGTIEARRFHRFIVYIDSETDLPGTRSATLESVDRRAVVGRHKYEVLLMLFR